MTEKIGVKIVSLADDIRALGGGPGGCRTCQWYRSLDPEAQEAIDGYLEGGGVVARLYDVCASWGLTVACRSFREHVQHHRESLGK